MNKKNYIFTEKMIIIKVKKQKVKVILKKLLKFKVYLKCTN